VKTALRILLGLAISLGALNAHAQRIFSQAELDTLLAPIALYPDPLLTHLLNASLYPDDVAAAAAWSRANPQLQGDAALATVESTSWHPSVQALVAYPDVLIRIAESPQWLADLGEAYAGQAAYVSATIQQLRARAQATGYLRSNEQQYVYQQAQTIYVQPVYPTVVYAPYYDPFVVYGTWWWPAYRPLCWRPFVARPVFVTRIVQPVRIVQPGRVWHHHGLVKDPRFTRPQVQVTPYRPIPESQRQPIIRSAPPMPQQRWGIVKEVPRTAAVQQAPIARPGPIVTPYQRIPESQRQPIIHSAPPMPQQRWGGIVKEVPRAALAQNAPVARPMPAPQWRATERPSRSVEARAGGNNMGNGGGNRGFGQGGSRGNGGGNGGGRHRG
jgi:hypothetical protein